MTKIKKMKHKNKILKNNNKFRAKNQIFLRNLYRIHNKSQKFNKENKLGHLMR